MNTTIKDMSWPLPDAGLEWRLRYGEPTNADMLGAASILAAYTQMIRDPQEKRQMVIGAIREALRGEEAKAEHGEPYDSRIADR